MVNSTLRVRLVSVFLLALGLFGVQGLYAQVNGGYTFTQSSGTYTAIAGGTTITFSNGTTVDWDNNITTSASGTSITLPFTFTYDGTAYTTCNVSSNGWISFGATAPTATNYTPIYANNPYAGAIAAFACDLITDSVHGITYLTQGAAPNKTITFQWTGARRRNSNGGRTIQADNINFQIVLHQTSNIISCNYGSCTASALVDSIQVGLRGTSDVDFNARFSRTSWSSTSTSATDSSDVYSSSTILPSSGLTFTWTPCTNSPLTLPVIQGFNSTNDPGCWNTQYISGTRNMQFVASSANPATTPEEGSDYVLWNAHNFGTFAETRFVSPPITSGAGKVQVSFYWYAENSSKYDTGIYLSEGATLEWSTNNTTWNSVQFYPRQDSSLTVGTGQWLPEVIDLPAGASNQTTLYVAWDFVSESGDNCALDNIDIDSRPALDAGVSGFVVPVPLNPSSQQIDVIISNYGSTTLTSVTVDWSVDGVAQIPVNITGLSLLSDSSTTVSLGTYTFLNGTSANTILANTTLPNGSTDGNVHNDTAYTSSLYACLSGTYTVGVGQQFTTLTNAIDYANTYGICGPTILELTDASYSVNETFPIELNGGTTATNTLTIQAASGNTATISSSSDTGIFAINSAGYVTINGGTGTQRNIIFSSSGNGGYDIQVNNTSLNVEINNCALLCNNGNNVDLEGAGSAGLTVSNCDIHDYTSGSYSLNGVYINNHNSSVTVSGNNVYNFTSSGVNVNSCDNTCDILNNNFWYVGTASTTQSAILVQTGNGHKIEGNYIGGQSSGGGVSGTPWVNSDTGSFSGILINGWTGIGGLPDTIAGNVIQNISLTNSVSAAFYGVNIQTGKAVIGYPGSGNRIGSTNSLLGITNAGATRAFIEGIWANGGQLYAQYDTIANLSAPSAASTTPDSSIVGGIYFHNGNNGTLLTNNLIYNLSNSAPYSINIDGSNTGGVFNVQGIVVNGRAGNFNVANNIVHSLYSTSTAAYYPSVAGISIDSTGSGSIYSNLVYDLSNTSTATAPYPGIAGIRVYLGTWNVYNNQVILTNNYNTNAATIYGISDLSGRPTNYFYNSVYVGGGANTGSAVSAAFNMDSSSSTMTLRDNIFYDVRTNTGSASGNNYAIDLNVTTIPTAFSSDYNDLYSAGTAANYVGIKGATGTPENFAGWKTQFTNVDLHSKNEPVYFNQSNPPVSDLTPANNTNCWIYHAGTPITTPTYTIAVPDDYNNTVRNVTTPDMGAIEFSDTTVITSLQESSGASSSTSSLAVCAGSSVDDTIITSNPAPAAYAWSTPDAYNPGSTSGFSRTVTTAMAGTYKVTVTDAIGCTSSATATLAVHPEPVFTVTQTNILCNGASTGQITVTVTSGTAPYKYSVDGGSTFPYSASPITGLSAVTYNVVVEDTIGCTSTTSTPVTLTQPTALTAPVITPTAVSTCFGASTGSITVSTIPTGGVTPYKYSLNGGTYQASVNFTGLAANTYTVTAKDANGCTVASNSAIVTQPTALTAPVITGTNITCNGAANGKVTVSTIPTGGTTPYKYSLNGGTYQAAVNFTALAPNTYTVTAKDANGCLVTSNTVILTQPTALTTPAITSTNITCNSSANGTVTVTTLPTGGTFPYKYSLNGGAYQTGTGFTSLGPNTYTVTAEDANSCTIISNSVVITQPAVLTAPVITGTNLTCHANASGIITVSTIPTGGTSPYQYSLNHAAYQTATSFTGLAAGKDTVIAQDANGCTVSSNIVTLTQPAALTTPVITVNNEVLCNGASTGKITVSTLPTGGTSPYQYTLNAGTYQTSNVFTGLPAGAYVLTAEDANGCTINSTSKTITQPTALAAPVITNTNVACNGASTGTVLVSTIPTGGVSPYQYSLNGGAYQTATGFTGLVANTYTVIAEDANSCTATSNSVVVTQPAALTAPVIMGTNLTCNANASGTITVSAIPTGGISPYTYSLNGGSYQTSTSFTGLAINTYTVTAQDANGCTAASNAVTLTQPAALTLPKITVNTEVLCNGSSTGKITVTTLPTGGTSPYQYTLNGGTYQTSTAFTGLPAGTYTLTAEDANGCTINSASKTITQPTALVAPVITGTNVLCNGGSSGTVTVSTIPTGGVSPYTYSLNGGTYQTSISFTGLAINTYTVIAEDANSCTVTSNSVVITQPSALTKPVITPTAAACNGAATGIITVTTLPTGGTSPYQYSLSGGPYQTSNVFSGLVAGSYTVKAEDANGCTNTSTAKTITQPTALTAPVITSSDVSCAGGTNGVETVSTPPTGGTSPYQYSLNGGAFQTSVTFVGLGANTYTVTAKDANGCTIVSNTDTILQPAPFVAPGITSTNVTCNAAANGTVTVSTLPSGGVSPYQYSLNGGAYQTGTGFTALVPNTYMVTAKDANGCLSTSNLDTVTQPAVLTAPVITATNVTCRGAANGIITVSTIPAGGTSPYQYSLNGGAYQTASTFTGLTPGAYTVTAQDANGCTKASTAKTITQPATLTAPVITGANLTCRANSSGMISVSTLPTGGTSPYQYSLNGGAFQTSTSFTGLSAGRDTVTAQDANGCTSISNIVILTQPAALTAPVITATNVSCNGVANGNITVTTIPTGGTSPYEYSLNGGAYQTSTAFTGLGPNTYTVTAEDAHGCSINSAAQTITQPIVLTAPVITSTDVSCFGGSNGVETVSTIPTGGTSPYQYSLNGGAYQTSTSFTGLSAGTISVTAKDANGCTVISNNDTITQPTALVAPIVTVTNATCNGLNNGKVTCTVASGGTPFATGGLYRYSLDGGTYQATKTWTGVGAEIVIITAKDANGCTVNSLPDTLTQPAVLTAPVITSTNVTCYGSANGTVAVSTLPTGGTSPYQYSINGGSYQTSTNFTFLDSAAYTVTVQDANGCTAVSNTDTVTQPPAFTAPVITAPIITSTNISCFGGSNGTINIVTLPTGGTSPYEYTLNHGSFQTSTTFTGLSAGIDSVTAQDANGCQVNSNIDTLTQPAAPVATPTITVTAATCNGSSTGKVTCSLGSGGTSPYTYVLSTGTAQSTRVFSNLPVGTYHVTVKDANGCSATSTNKTITQPAALTAPVIAGTNLTCNANATGAVNITTIPSGGTSPYEYSLNGGAYQTGLSFTSLAANTYTVTAQDTNGCNIASNVVVVTQPAVLTVPVLTVTDVTCNGASDGIIKVSTIPTGGTAPYEYSLSGGAYQTSTVFSGLTPNTYTVTAEDANGCTKNSAAKTITQPAALTAPAITKTNVTCNGASNGTITITTLPTGGTTPYKYSLNGGAYQTSTDFAGLPNGIYTVTAQDANGCTITSASRTITQPTALVAPVITVTNVTCNSSANGTVTVSTLPTGGTSPYEYSLNGGSYQTATAFSGLGPNTYVVTAQDANGCTINSTSKTITQPAVLTTPTITGTNVLCNGASDGVVTVTTLPTGGTSPYKYSIDGSTYQTSTSFTGLVANTYTVVAKDANGCISNVSNIDTLAQPTALVTPTLTVANATCNGLADGKVTSSAATGGTSPYKYSLNGGAYQNSRVFSNVPANTYTVTVKDANGCSVISAAKIVTQPTAITTPLITNTNVSCNGDNNGAVNVTTLPTGGTSPYQYSLNGGAYQTGTAFTGLVPNSYSVLVEDANSCTITSNTVTVTQPATLTATASNSGPYSPTNTIQLTSAYSGGTGAYHYHWSGPLSFGSASQDTNIVNSTDIMTGAYSITITDANGCSATAVTDVLVTSSLYTWTGAIDNNWGNISNWSPPSPVGGPNSCGASVIIPFTTNQPVISSAIQVGNVVVDANVQMKLNSNLSVCQNWTGAATGDALTTGSGIVIFDGSVAQIITGNTSFNELMLNNTAGVALQSGAGVNIETAVDLKAGNFDATNGSLTFVSTSITQVAIIDNFSAGYQGTLTGNINAERFYLASLTYNQHFMGSPVSNPPFAQFGAYGTTGWVTPKPDCDESQMATGSPYGGVFSYHESHGNTHNCGLAQWYVEAGSGVSVNGQGYSILKPGGGLLTLTGQANLNTTYSLTGLTNSNWENTSLQNRVMSSGWQLVSNPYLATLQVSTNPANSDFDNQVQVWYCNGPYSGTYQAFMTSEDAVIPPFQAFQVHKTVPASPPSTYTISASDRVRTAAEFYAQNDNELDIVAQNISTGLLDKTVVAFNRHATDEFDPGYDADKFGGSLNRHTLYSLNHNKWMARNVLKSINSTSTVPVGFEPGATGNYALTFDKLSTFDPTTYIFLEDKQTGAMYNIRSGNYLFSADSADEWNRFVLHFTPPTQIGTENATCNAQGSINIVQPGPANWNYVITDANNATVASGILNHTSPVSIPAAEGNYTLTLVNNNNYTVVKTIVVGGAPSLTASFTAPATIVDQSNVTFTANSPNATEFLWSFGDGSIVSGTSNPTYKYVQPGVYTVTLTVADAAGCAVTYTQTITVTSATGVTNVGSNGDINMWSYENRIYVDFTQLQHVNAVIKFYNILGQEIGSSEYTSNTIYQNVISNIDAAYVVVSVKNDGIITTRKLFIVNTR